MHTYGGLNSILAALAVLALAGALSLYYGIACALFWWLKPRATWAASLLFAALWTMAEMARGTWLTGFGWGAIGYAHVDGPLAGYAAWVGAYGVAAIAAWLAASGALLLRSGWSHRLAVVAVVAGGIFAPVVFSTWTVSQGNMIITLLQGNIAQNEKFEAGLGVPLALEWYAEQLVAAKGDLVVAPETAIPLLPQQLPDDYWRSLQDRFKAGDQAALVGIPLGNAQSGYSNSVVGLKPDQSAIWRYDKHHLVPFGEFIPPFFQWFLDLMHIPLGDFNRGDVGQPSFEWKGQRLAANICYEDLFGEELSVRFRDVHAAPTLMVNVSNIGWFGNTVAIDQHLQISRMRALEFERPMVRATNTGPTVMIDHKGRVTASLARHTRGVLVGQVQGRSGTTPYAWWVGRFGLWPLWLLGLAMIWWARRLRRHEESLVHVFDAPDKSQTAPV
jgi:apolipoprotein N-acyltransferase